MEQKDKKRKRSAITRRLLWVVWLVLLVVLAGMAIRVAMVMQTNVRTETAILEDMTDAVHGSALIALDSETVYSESGILYYTVESGQRVSAGSQIAEIYTSESAAAARYRLDEVQEELDRLKTAMKTTALSGDTENYRKQLQSGLVSLLDLLDTNDYSGVPSAAGEVTLASNKLKIATDSTQDYSALEAQLTTQRDQYAAQAVPQTYITASQTGYFIAASGGDRVPMQYDSLADATVGQISTLLASDPEYYGSNVAGYIINDYKWHMFVLIDSKDAGRFTVGSKALTVSHSDLGTELPVRVESVEVDEALGLARVELYCEHMRPEILKVQGQTVDIVFNTYSGLRVPKDALRVNDGVDGVYIYFYSQVSYREVEIILEDEYYVLVRYQKTGYNPDGKTALKPYDEVIVDSGGTELQDGKII